MRRDRLAQGGMEAGTVVIADDDEDFVALLRAAFESANLQNPIQSVNDGHRLVDYLTGKGPCADRQEYPLPLVLFLDVRLPRRSGFEVLQWLRRHPEFHGMHVIMLSGIEIDGDAERARQLGAEAYLVKPCNFQKLVEMLECLRGGLLEEHQLVTGRG